MSDWSLFNYNDFIINGGKLCMIPTPLNTILSLHLFINVWDFFVLLFVTSNNFNVNVNINSAENSNKKKQIITEWNVSLYNLLQKLGDTVFVKMAVSRWIIAGGLRSGWGEDQPGVSFHQQKTDDIRTS